MITNADMIRRMTDEQLAEFLIRAYLLGYSDCYNDKLNPYAYNLEWLQKEAYGE